MRRTDAITRNVPTQFEEHVSNLSALPLSRAKRGGEEEGQKLDLFELRRSHQGRRKSRIGRRVGLKKMKIQRFAATSSTPSSKKYCHIEIL